MQRTAQMSYVRNEIAWQMSDIARGLASEMGAKAPLRTLLQNAFSYPD